MAPALPHLQAGPQSACPASQGQPALWLGQQEGSVIPAHPGHTRVHGKGYAQGPQESAGTQQNIMGAAAADEAKAGVASSARDTAVAASCSDLNPVHTSLPTQLPPLPCPQLRQSCQKAADPSLPRCTNQQLGCAEGAACWDM